MTNAEAQDVLRDMRDDAIETGSSLALDALIVAISALEGPGREEVARALAQADRDWDEKRHDRHDGRDYFEFCADAVLALRGK